MKELVSWRLKKPKQRSCSIKCYPSKLLHVKSLYYNYKLTGAVFRAGVYLQKGPALTPTMSIMQIGFQKKLRLNANLVIILLLVWRCVGIVSVC